MLKKIIGLSIIILLSFIVTKLQSQQINPNSQPISQKENQSKDNKKVRKNQDNTPTTSLIIQKTTPTQTLQEGTSNKNSNSQNNSNKWRDIFHNPVDVFTGIIAIFTILLVMAGLWQVAANRKAAKEQLRAWIGINNINGPAIIGKPLDIVIEFINVGKTPATDVLIYAHAEPFDEFNFPDFDKKYVVNEKIGSIAILIPKVPQFCKLSASNNQPIGNVQVERISSGTQIIFVQGFVKYKDVFKYSHWLTFCYYLETDRKSYTAYKEHNEIDKDVCFLCRFFSRRNQPPT